MEILKVLTLSLIINGFLISGCFHLPPDSPLEEYTEDLIEEFTGLDIDLTSEDGK